MEEKKKTCLWCKILDYFKKLFKITTLISLVGVPCVISAIVVGLAELYILTYKISNPFWIIISLIIAFFAAILITFLVKGRGSFLSSSPNNLDIFLLSISFSFLVPTIIFSNVYQRYYSLYNYWWIIFLLIMCISFGFWLGRMFLYILNFKEPIKYYSLKDLKDKKNYPEDVSKLFIKDEATEDLFGRDVLIQECHDYIFNTAIQDTRIIGITGKWGSGKTSLLNIAWEKVTNKKDFLFINDFDCLSYQDEKSLFIAIVEKLYKELNLGDIDRKAISQIKKLADSIKNSDYVKSDLIDFIFPKKDSDQIYSMINNALVYRKKRVVFALDNLDRATEENVVYLYKAISSILKFDRITYVCLYDEDIVCKALTSNSLPSNFLDKLLSNKIEIRENSSDNFNNFMNETMDVYLNAYIKDEYKYMIDKEQITKSLAYITKPRDYVRLINFLSSKLHEIQTLNISDLITLVVIKTLNFELYEFIFQNKLAFCANREDDPVVDRKSVVKEFNEKFPNGKYNKLITLIFPKFFDNSKINESTRKELSFVPVESLLFIDTYFLTGKNEIIQDYKEMCNRIEKHSKTDAFTIVGDLLNRDDIVYAGSFVDFIKLKGYTTDYLNALIEYDFHFDFGISSKLLFNFLLRNLKEDEIENFFKLKVYDFKSLYLYCWIYDKHIYNLDKFYSTLTDNISKNKIDFLDDKYKHSGNLKACLKCGKNILKNSIPDINKISDSDLFYVLKELVEDTDQPREYFSARLFSFIDPGDMKNRILNTKPNEDYEKDLRKKMLKYIEVEFGI